MSGSDLGGTMKNFFSFVSVVWVSLLLVASPASAATEIFEVTDYAGGSHGLWTNDTFSKNFFSFQNDVRFVVDRDNGTGELTGTAINKDGLIADIVITLSGFLDSIDNTPFIYKKEGGIGYDPANDSPDLDFFTNAVGSITIDGDVYDISTDPFRGNTVFQFGVGASAKNKTQLGGSAWLNIDGQKKHWDLNFAMSPVPEPATWLMMILGLGLVGGALRAQTRRAAWLARAA